MLPGVAADVVCVSSPGLLFQALQARQGRGPGESWIVDQVFPADRAAPMVAVLDGHPPTLALLATINQVRSTALGVSRFRAGRFDRGRLPVPQHRHRQHRPRRARRHRLTAATAMEAVSSRLLANLAGHARCCPAPIRSVRRHRRHHEGSPS